MNRRWMGIVGICLVLIVAGCAGIGTNGEPANGADDDIVTPPLEPDSTNETEDADDHNDTSDSDPSDDTESDELDELALPDGVSEDSIDNPQALFETHQEAIEGLNVTVSVGQFYNSDDSEVGIWFTAKSVPDDDRAWIRVETNDGYGEYYTENGVTYTKEVEGTTTRYYTQTEFPGEDEPRYGADGFVEFALMNATFESAGTGYHNDVPVHWFDVVDIDADEFDIDEENVTNEYAGEVLVAESGIVTYALLEQTIITEDGETHRFTIEVIHQDIGMTNIERPEWYNRAADG